jgi:uncharacterized membrane protein
MIAILLAVIAAVGWGAADYFGGGASRDGTPVFVVVALGELLGVVLMAPALIARGVPPPASPRLLLAAVAGVAVTAELGLIYRALARGEAFITAPVGALGTAGAVTIGLIGGDPLGITIGTGLLCAGRRRGQRLDLVWRRRARAQELGRADRCNLCGRRGRRRHHAHLPARRQPPRPLLGHRHRARQHRAVRRPRRTRGCPAQSLIGLPVHVIIAA